MAGIWVTHYDANGYAKSASIYVLPCYGCLMPIADTVVGDAPLCHACARVYRAWRAEHQRLRALPTWARDWLRQPGGRGEA